MKHLRGCALFTHPTQRPPGHPTDCTCPPLSGDTLRVVQWFREHPGSTVNEAKVALWLHITARMSDARERGIEFDKTEQRVNGRRVVRFTVREPKPPILRGEQAGLGW